MAYRIQCDKCISCGACAAACPVGCISQGDTCFVIDESACISCGTCAGVCPVKKSRYQFIIFRIQYTGGWKCIVGDVAEEYQKVK